MLRLNLGVWLSCFAITNHLLTGLLGNNEFCFSRISMFLSISSREKLRFSWNKIHCFPRGQCYLTSKSSICVLQDFFGGKVLAFSLISDSMLTLT